MLPGERRLVALAAAWTVAAAGLALLLASGVRGPLAFVGQVGLYAVLFALLLPVLAPALRRRGRDEPYRSDPDRNGPYGHDPRPNDPERNDPDRSDPDRKDPDGSDSGRNDASRAGRSGARALGIVLAAAALGRVFLLATPPTLSGDLYRMVWEGQVVAAGQDPWRLPPDAPELAPLRERLPEIRERVEYWKLPAIYPPGAQWFAAAVTSISPRPTVLKGALLLAEAALVGALVLLLRRRGLDPLLVVAYLWNPLPLVEIAGSGHGDILGVAFVAWGLVGAAAGRPLLAAALGAVSGTVKFAGFALLPFLLRGAAGVRRRIGMALVALVAATAVVAPFFVTGTIGTTGTIGGAVGGLRERFAEFAFSLGHYLRHWQFNDSFFLLLEAALDDAARPAAAALFAAVFVALGVRRPALPPSLAFALLAGSAFLLSPAAHPWYLLWCLPFLVLHPERRALFVAGLALSLTTALSYHPFWTTPPGAPWLLPPALRLAEYLSPAAFAIVVHRRAAPRGPGASP